MSKFVWSIIYHDGNKAEDVKIDSIYLTEVALRNGFKQIITQYITDCGCDLLDNYKNITYSIPLSEHIKTLMYDIFTQEKVLNIGERTYILSYNILYGNKSTRIKASIDMEGVTIDIKFYIEMISNVPIENKQECIDAIKDILDTIESTKCYINKAAIICMLYDIILPKCYEYIPEEKFWVVTIKKLHEFYNNEKVDFNDIMEKRLPELTKVLNMDKVV